MKTNQTNASVNKSTKKPSKELQSRFLLLFQKDVITDADLKALNLTSGERTHFFNALNEKLNSLTGHELDKFHKKIDPLLDNQDRKNIWERNHLIITNALHALMRETGQMPTKMLIAQRAGLSRPTIDKHLKEYQTHPALQDQAEVSKMMIPNVLASVYKMAVSGDVRSARLYFEMMGLLKQPTTTIQKNTVIEQQNNFVQINETTISQQTLQALPAEQLFQIEQIIKQSLPEGKKEG